MDLHLSLGVFRPDQQGLFRLGAPFTGWSPQGEIPPEFDVIDVSIAAGKWQEYPVPPWAHVLLWVDQGMCLSNPDGEEPDVPAGSVCLYRVRNRPSAVFLVAGPEGCKGKLVLVPGRISTLPPPFPE